MSAPVGELTDQITGAVTRRTDDEQQIDSLTLTVLINDIHSKLVDDADDLGSKVNELKGFLNETLGDLPFKCAIILVVFLNVLYTFYETFFSATALNSEVRSDCYCDTTDKVFYRAVLIVSMILWISFLIVNASYSTFRHVNCFTHNEARLNNDRNKEIKKIAKALKVLQRNERKLKSSETWLQQMF